jgi:ADP-dependent NAD(P)H-hydrate dehydratase
MAATVSGGLLRKWPLPSPDPDGDKLDRGQVLVVGGSVEVPGGVLLSGIAALRAGAGKLQVLTTQSTAVALGVALPEALVAGLPETSSGGIDPQSADEILQRAGKASAVLIGPGMVDDDAVSDLVAGLVPRLDQCDATFVFDAAAVRCLPLDLMPFRVPAIVTPNRRELADLLKVETDDLDTERVSKAAGELGAVIATRGAVAGPDGGLWEHEEGDVGLATSGSGDVLSGIVAGLAARGAEPAQAAVWGMAAHARAGKHLASTFSGIGYLARELLDEIPAVLAELAT